MIQCKMPPIARRFADVHTTQEARDKDVAHWQEFVNRFFSPRGIYRTNIHSKNDVEAVSDKSIEMTSAAVPHFFNASGAKKIDLHLGQGTTDKPLPTPLGDCHFIENGNVNMTMWFETSHVSFRAVAFDGPRHG